MPVIDLYPVKTARGLAYVPSALVAASPTPRTPRYPLPLALAYTTLALVALYGVALGKLARRAADWWPLVGLALYVVGLLALGMWATLALYGWLLPWHAPLLY